MVEDDGASEITASFAPLYSISPTVIPFMSATLILLMPFAAETTTQPLALSDLIVIPSSEAISATPLPSVIVKRAGTPIALRV